MFFFQKKKARQENDQGAAPDPKVAPGGVIDRIKNQISQHPVLLYMKGTSLMPMCGFSARALELVKLHCPQLVTINVLEDPELREAIKDYSNWPTIPQLYVKGEFVGGCDILVEMEEEGSLASLLEEACNS